RIFSTVTSRRPGSLLAQPECRMRSNSDVSTRSMVICLKSTCVTCRRRNSQSFIFFAIPLPSHRRAVGQTQTPVPGVLDAVEVLPCAGKEHFPVGRRAEDVLEHLQAQVIALALLDRRQVAVAESLQHLEDVEVQLHLRLAE